MYLQSGTLLQGGKYRIEKVLGQGGFGITYLAVQTNLKNRKVAVKEFFLKEHCERDASTSYVSMGTSGSKDLVLKFKNKFIKEAETIAEMDNPHIVRIYDVFEENGTAYYVMEYLPGGSLSDRIPADGLPESEALGYIRQVADALSYIHGRKILHLDIKPSNILFRKADEAVLIDFGISKHYEESGGSQTSSTPVGVSRGYAPLEQYKRGGVAQFTPATDVYSVGATLYRLLTGQTPPNASRVNEFGLPPLPHTVSALVRSAVERAMSPKRIDRPQSVGEFLTMMDEGTIVPPPPPPPPPSPKKSFLKWILGLIAGMVAAAVLYIVIDNHPDIPEHMEVVLPDTTIATLPLPDQKESEPVQPSDPLASQFENDLKSYENLIEMGAEYSSTDATLSQARSKYEQAVSYETKYHGTKYSSHFSKGASASLKSVESRIAAAKAEAERAEQERQEREAREAEERRRKEEAERAEQERQEREAREAEERRRKEEEDRKRNETSYINGILRVKGVEYPMVYVSGGSFDMGATSEQDDYAYDRERPVHRVTLSSYSIGKYEVTQELWEAVMGNNPSRFKGPRRPVEQVSWDDCVVFIDKLNALTGASFRLPTEAEWEFAARGGNSSRCYRYSGSDTIGDVAWYEDYSGSQTHDVGLKSPNELGLYDMSGNVREWCNDWYGSYSSSSQTNPKGPRDGSYRVFRGSSWNSDARACRVSYRYCITPDWSDYYMGLRLCH